MLNLIYSTIRITFADMPFFQKYTQKILSETRISVVTEHPEIDVIFIIFSRTFLNNILIFY